MRLRQISYSRHVLILLFLLPNAWVPAQAKIFDDHQIAGTFGNSASPPKQW